MRQISLSAKSNLDINAVVWIPLKFISVPGVVELYRNYGSMPFSPEEEEVGHVIFYK